MANEYDIEMSHVILFTPVVTFPIISTQFLHAVLCTYRESDNWYLLNWQCHMIHGLAVQVLKLHAISTYLAGFCKFVQPLQFQTYITIAGI